MDLAKQGMPKAYMPPKATWREDLPAVGTGVFCVVTGGVSQLILQISNEVHYLLYLSQIQVVACFVHLIPPSKNKVNHPKNKK